MIVAAIICGTIAFVVLACLVALCFCGIGIGNDHVEVHAGDVTVNVHVSINFQEKGESHAEE